MVRAARAERHLTFQFTRPRGGAMLSCIVPQSGYVFQFTRPRGGAMLMGDIFAAILGFNSHAPVGARFFEPIRRIF